MHKLVFERDTRVSRVNGRVSTVEHADGIHNSARVLHGLGGGHGRTGDSGIEGTARSRGAVGEEHNDLLGAFALRAGQYLLGLLQTVIRMRPLRSLQSTDGTLDARSIGARTGRHTLLDNCGGVKAHHSNAMLAIGV